MVCICVCSLKNKNAERFFFGHHIVFLRHNAKLSGRGLKADNLCIIKIFVKAKTFKNRSVAPDPLQRHVMFCYLIIF